MWSVYLALKTTISYTLYGSTKIGQFIVTTLYSLITNCLHFLNKLLALLTVIIEDFTIFIRDVIHSLNNIVLGISTICERIVAGVYAVWQSILHLIQVGYTSVSLLYNAGLNGLTAVINGIKNMCIFVKQIIIMFGEGVWFIIIYIPESLMSFVVFLFSYTKNLYIQVQDGIYAYVKHLHDSILESVFNCYNFLTDVPTESVIGIIIAVCFLYIFMQFYTVLYRYFRSKMLSFFHALKLKYNQLKSTVNRISSRNNQEVAPNTNVAFEASASTKAIDDGSCIICQDHPKCILVLPCKHLCLCSNCTPRLMRYSGRCPICRKRINSTMKIFT